MIRRPIPLALLIVALAVGAPAATPTLPPAAWILEEVRTLASTPMEGRAAGTEGADRAAEHLAEVFRAAGLAPAGEDGTFFQSFRVPTGLAYGTPNTLALVAPTRRALTLGQDWAPLTISTSGTATSELLFVGYGITAPELGYDDYAGIDARGKIVLAMSREPRSQDPASPFRRPEAARYADRDYKIINARQHGAAAFLLVPHPRSGSPPLPVPRGLSQAQGIVSAAVTAPAGEALVAAGGLRLGDLADAIDRGLAPRSVPVAGVTLQIEVELLRRHGTARNVLGRLPGTDPVLRDQAIVIGAHYDHLGRGGEASLAPDQYGQIHPGADDNASGTVAVLALARAFAAAGGAPRTLIFAAFSGEELGLLGSAEYVRRPATPLDRTALMVNLDMVGRLRDGKLYVGGIDSGAGLRPLVTRVSADLGFSLVLAASPFGPSDHTSFYVAGVPVLFFFTGAHADYHRPSDTWERINAPGIAQVATLVARVVETAAGEAARPAYVKIDAPPPGSPGARYGPVFGVVPEFGEGGRAGVKVTGVRPGSPADKAGVRPGDVIVRFAGVEVKTLQDLTFALRSKHGGDEVQVVVVRDGRETTVQAVLADRGE